MSNKTSKSMVQVGNAGPGVRSDCLISMELTDSSGINIDLKSRVESMYGRSIRELVMEVMKFYGIKNAWISIEDSGALPFVLLARLEFLIKSFISSDKEFLPELYDETASVSHKESFRFSRLYLPGNSPSLMLNAGIHKPEGMILDLEDSVAPEKKQEARYLVRNALRSLDFMGAEKMVRINQLPEGYKDLPFIVKHNVQLILVPKCEGAGEITGLEEEISTLKKKSGTELTIFLMPIIESALGIEKAYEIACASENIVAMAIGLEDYTADIGVSRTKEGNESLYARTRLVNACKAAGIQAIDSVFSDVGDMEGLAEAVKKSRSLGFEGMGCIHPRQIRVIQQGFIPSASEIRKAENIARAFHKAAGEGRGVVSLGTKMIDAPVVKRARKTIDLAIKMGLLNENWLQQEKL